MLSQALRYSRHCSFCYNFDVDNDNQQEKAWVEDGIIFIKYAHAVDLNAINKMQDQALEVVLKAQVTHAPLIVELQGDAQGEPKLALHDLGRAINHELTKHMTGIWLVGKVGETEDPITKIVNKFFLGGRVHWVDTVDHARAAAKQYIANDSNILENDN